MIYSNMDFTLIIFFALRLTFHNDSCSKIIQSQPTEYTLLYERIGRFESSDKFKYVQGKDDLCQINLQSFSVTFDSLDMERKEIT